MQLDSTIVEASKVKVIFLIILGIAFITLGIWLLTLDTSEIEAHHRFNSPIFVYGAGIACVVFFALCTGGGIWRLFSNKPGLELNSKSIKIYGAGSNVEVLWEDCSGFSIYEVHKQKMLVVNLHNPQKYIEQESQFRRKLAQASHNLCGSPVSISAGALQIKFDQLVTLCEKYQQAYAKNA